MRIKFTVARVVDDHRKGTPAEERYEAGKVYGLPESSARHWMSRGIAIPAADPLDDGTKGGSNPGNAGDEVMSPSELLAAIKASPPMAFNDFRAEAVKIFGDQTPAKKVDIIAALDAAVAATDRETPA